MVKYFLKNIFVSANKSDAKSDTMLIQRNRHRLLNWINNSA